MIEGADKDACKAKKIDGGGVRTSKSGQSAARTSSKINHQTFTKLRNSISKFIGKTKLKMGRLRSILGRILPSFAADSRPSKQQLRSEFPPRHSQARFSKRKISSARLSQKFLNRLGLRRSGAGYVLILVIAALPVLLFGAKYILDQQTLSGRRATGTEYVKDSSLGSQRLVKQCAQEAALEVAKHWNPGLTLYQQREAMLRIADEVYNAAPTYVDSTVIRAVHGLDVARESTTQGRTYEPIKITRVLDERLSPSLKQIARTENTTDIYRYFSGRGSTSDYTTSYVMHSFKILYDSLRRDHSILTTEDNLFSDFCYKKQSDNWFLIWAWPVVIGVSSGNRWEGHFVSSKSYTTRTDLTDETVKIECEGDKIKVTTDDDVAYAVPAECNVDIILTVPTNSAASNENNYDKNTLTSGMPYEGNDIVPSLAAKNTPMYQIAQEYRTFLKKFFYTRGVNVGVIPYSGNISLNSYERSDWTTAPTRLNATYFLNGTYQPMIIGSIMYGTKGSTGGNLTEYGVYSNVCGLLCRGSTTSHYGNTVIMGDLLSTGDPSNYKFRRMLYNPCYAGNANLLSMKCEKNSKYEQNPYFILEMTPDVKFIYGMLGAFYPYYDDRNVSNFIFIPVTWANNLLQEWSAKGENSGANTSDDSENLGRLSTPSKTTAGRKKALILVVNKPDWFEPGELTYLGFDNDFSEIPMIESDCIRGDIDYSDTSKYFADGTKYNTGDNQIDGQPLVAGAKKILKLTGFERNATTGLYECDNGTARLKFPQKYLVKLVVEGKITWTNAGRQYEHPENKACWGNIAWDGTKFLTGTSDSSGKVITSTDGETWTATPTTHTQNPTDPEINMVVRPAYGEGMWQNIGRSYPSYISYDGFNWTQISSTWGCDAQAYGNGGFMHFGHTGTARCKAYWMDPSDTTKILTNGDFSEIENNIHRALGFCNGKWCAITWDGRFITSYDNGANWAVESLSGASPGDVTGTTSEWYGPVYGFGRYWAICRGDNGGSLGSGNTDENNSNSRIVFSRDGKTWYKDNAALGTLCGTLKWFRGLGFNGKRFVSASDNGYFAYGDCNATIRFTNITSNETHCTQADTEYKITEKKEFFIEPDQISDPSTEGDEYEITFDATNLRLISAEITNRPYTKVTPTVTRNGDVYTLNAKVPFVVTVNRTGTFTYTTPDGIQMTKNTTGGWGYMQVTPETHRYEKTFDDNGNPIYTVTMSFSGTNPIFAAAVGIAEERSESVNLDPGLDWEAEGTKPKVAIDDYLSYQKTDFADSTGEATVDAANGKIYCPIGTVLHVKAVPNNGSVTFYNTNGVSENVGTHVISGGSSRQFYFSGSNNLKNYQSNTATIYIWSTTGGINFGHNFSTKKLKLRLSNTVIDSITLKNQVIRWNTNFSYTSDNVNAKGSINNPHGIVAGDIHRATDVYTYWLDPCIMHDGSDYSIISDSNLSCLNAKVRCYNFHLGLQGIQKGKLIMCIDSASGVGDRGDRNFTYQTTGSKWIDMGISPAVSMVNKWIVVDFTNVRPYDSTELRIFFGRLKDSENNPILYDMNGAFFLNTENKSYKGSVLSANDENLLNNVGIYTLAEGDDTWICFCGDGALDVIVAPLPGTIKFHCENESGMTHELYKENNFCIEPSQMTNNGNGQQYVSYTASNCNVTATYEYTNRMLIKLKKPSEIPSVKWEIYGHKKEMKWKQASGSVNTSSHVGSAQKLKFDGKRCYFGSVDGDIMYSDDFGKIWKALGNTKPISSSAMFTIGPSGLYYANAETGALYCSSDEGRTWSNIAGLDTGNWWDAFTYSFDADNTNAKAMAVRAYGQIKTSSDCITWVDKTSLPSNSQGYYFGHLYYNGNWIARNRNNPTILYRSTDGSNWTEINSNIQNEDASWLEPYLVYGSNLVMILKTDSINNRNSDKFYTSTDNTLSSFTTHDMIWPYDDFGSISYANGNFIACKRRAPIQFAYGTYHDGVMWINKSQRYSREINSKIGFNWVNNVDLDINMTNSVVTSIKGTYVEIVKKYEKAIEYKKIRLPQNSRYVDYSKNVNGKPEFYLTSTHSGFYSHWGYDTSKGYWTIKDSRGWESVFYLQGIHGDYTSMGYSDEAYEALHYHKDGIYNKNNQIGPYDAVITSGLDRFFVNWENRPNTVYSTSHPPFLWSCLRTENLSGKVGDLHWILATATLPINAALWAGASGETLYAYDWQSAPDATYGRVARTYYATEAVKEVTKSACEKLKSDWGNNLHVYLIKYRKQTQYKNRVTQATEDFDYDYLNACATENSDDYIYDITETDPAAARTQLNQKLQAIADHIKEWAGYTEARNVEG